MTILSMNEKPNVVVVLARCRGIKGMFGIRMEEKFPEQWVADWAFVVQESKARKEGYGQNRIHGSFIFDPAYPGCPYCGASAYFLCGCGKISCWDGEARVVTCPWCGVRGELSGAVEQLNIYTDR